MNILRFNEFINENHLNEDGGVANATGGNTGGMGAIIAPAVGSTPGNVWGPGSGAAGSGDIPAYDRGDHFGTSISDKNKTTAKFSDKSRKKFKKRKWKKGNENLNDKTKPLVNFIAPMFSDYIKTVNLFQYNPNTMSGLNKNEARIAGAETTNGPSIHSDPTYGMPDFSPNSDGRVDGGEWYKDRDVTSSGIPIKQKPIIGQPIRPKVNIRKEKAIKKLSDLKKVLKFQDFCDKK